MPASDVSLVNVQKRKRSSAVEQVVKKHNSQIDCNDGNQNPHAGSRRDNIGWSHERCLMLVFNSFTLPDIQKVLETQQLPKGIPKGWHVGYCAYQDCKTMTAEDMTDSGWCKDHFALGPKPLPLWRVRQILIHELLKRADSRTKLMEIAEESNGVFLVRREIEELLAVVLRTPKREDDERTKERQRMVLKDCQDHEPCKTLPIEIVKTSEDTHRKGQHIPRNQSPIRKALSETKVQLQATKAVANHNTVVSESGKKRKAIEEISESFTKKPRFNMKSFAASLKPSSLEIHFKNVRAKATVYNAQTTTNRTPWSRRRAQEASRKKPKSPRTERDSTSLFGTRISCAENVKKTSDPDTAGPNHSDNPQTPEFATPKKRRSSRKRQVASPMDFWPPSSWEDFVRP